MSKPADGKARDSQGLMEIERTVQRDQVPKMARTATPLITPAIHGTDGSRSDGASDDSGQ